MHLFIRSRFIYPLDAYPSLIEFKDLFLLLVLPISPQPPIACFMVNPVK
ncbi:hypothetical protein SLEP1_g15117 [Rubroshorea leprosula]|uniref:Uncharacterized protein n=1 Tax=Rubroshorea leprosula TaxID=152421 RepID=A0AAV5IVU7_9ROSI|nr:hypothetical protein SLEP1_g15117 [Rubroshorea leprosula]